jgi:HD-GYP domain-containing protein (c-di-GMP phosphodiesterase class II)
MNAPNSAITAMPSRTITTKGLVLLVAVLAYAGVSLVQSFGNVEEEREMLRWQNKLSLIADSRVADVDGWLDRHFKELGGVAANPSLQLYLTALMNPSSGESRGLPSSLAEEPAQAVFLRNLLVLTADRMHFTARHSDELQSVKANVGKPSGVGLGIVDTNGKVIVSTQSLGAVDSVLAEKIAKAPKAESTLIDVYKTAEGEARVGFVLPIYAIQGDAKADQQIGKLFGIKPVDDELFKLLLQPGVNEKTLEAVLIRKEGDNVSYISTDANGTVDGAHPNQQLALNTPGLDAAYALTKPGEFALKSDWQSNRVLMTSRALTHAPWVLMLHIDRDQALRESDSWRSSMKFLMGFALLALICSIVAAWWYGSSRRATMLAQQTAKLAAYSMAQERLLRVVSDNQPEPIFIADAKQLVRFANQKTGERFKMDANEITGKSIASLMGPDMAKAYAETNESTLAMHRTTTRVHKSGVGIESRTISSIHIPLDHIPVDGLANPTPGVLVVDQDITEVVTEKERRERILHQLINTLVKLVDARDPYSANHSQAVSVAAREVAQGMGLAPVLVETARIAGKIMNIGKVVVPTEILTKKKALEKEEMQAVRDGLNRSVALLQGIEFDGPVVNTLRQSAERVDGTGPLALKGDDILITARIIAAANSFVGMISPRSYRTALSVEMATGNLLQNVDTQFDRKVVVALINFVENKKGRETLLNLVTKKVA